MPRLLLRHLALRLKIKFIRDDLFSSISFIFLWFWNFPVVKSTVLLELDNYLATIKLSIDIKGCVCIFELTTFNN